MAFNRNPGLKCIAVVDERSAAFIALGIAQSKGEMVALCCTSGSALLNYAPAVSESYYKGLPLIVISADRPTEWIDQADSQTIRQNNALSGITIAQASLTGMQKCDDESRWYANRTINNLLLKASAVGRSGPVHLNVHLGEPLDTEADDLMDAPARVIKEMLLSNIVPASVMHKFVCEKLANRKVCMVFGFMQPDTKLTNAIRRIVNNTGFVVLAEPTANLFGCGAISCIDPVLAYIHKTEHAYKPDIVLYLGGSIVSRSLKEFIRRSGAVCYRVGTEGNVIDTFMNLEGIFNTSPLDFCKALASAVKSFGYESSYRDMWMSASSKVNNLVDDNIDSMPWCDCVAVATVLRNIPKGINLQVSNGMAVRYAMGVPVASYRRFDCNRGVSGIDGCTSTAVGANIGTDRTTLLISGDMCAQYDIAPFASGLITPKFKMVVLGNGEGNIFHVIKATRNLPEVDNLISNDVVFPAEKLAEAYGMAYFRASGKEELLGQLPNFFREKNRPAILYIDTSGQDSAHIYRKFIKNLIN